MEQLRRMEKRLTMLRILELVDKPIQGKFDLKHLQSVHRYIFQDIYDWAGEIEPHNKFYNISHLVDHSSRWLIYMHRAPC